MASVVPFTQLSLKGRTTLVRCDFNVPLDGKRIVDPGRIDATLPTVRHVLGVGGAAVLCSHLGRPRERTPDLSLKPVAEYLSAALERKVALAPDCIGDITFRMASALKPGEALLLENLRFHREEEANDPDFAHELARGKQVFINDAFAAAHRTHASTVGVTRFIAERAAGFLMIEELEALRAVMENPAHPYVLIMGGAKVADKIGVLHNLLPRVDVILIGGAMAYTFLRARGTPVGAARVEDDKFELARALMEQAAARGVVVVLPSDHIVAPAPESGAPKDISPALARAVDEIGPGQLALDIGPRTTEEFIKWIARARTVVWNGPLGFFELPPFNAGTLKVGEALANLEGVRSLLGGGDTAAAVGGQSWSGRFTHVSTGGGATLEYLEGRELPGIKALMVEGAPHTF